MDFFKPVEIKEYYINRIASGMSKYFYINIFDPIFDILNGENVVFNNKIDRNGNLHSDVNGQFISKQSDNFPQNIDINTIKPINFTSEDIKKFDIKGSIKEYYQDKIQGTFVIHPAIGRIDFTAKGLSETLNKNKGKNLYILSKIPEIIKESKFDRIEDKKHDRTDNIKQFHLLYGKIQTGNKQKLILIKIAEDFKGNKFFILKPVQTIKNSLAILPQFYRGNHLQGDYEAITIIADLNPVYNSIVNNSKDDLINAIKSGKVYYKDGAFRTKDRFSNAISTTLENMGAKFRSGAYYIERSLIPLDYLQAMGIAESQTLFKLSAIKTFLDNYSLTDKEVDELIQTAATEMFKSLERDIVKSAQEKEVPVIELGLVNPKTQEVPKAKIKEIQDYWNAQDKKIKELNDKRKKAEKTEKANKSVDVSSSDLQSQINKINENAFKNAPKVEINVIALDEQSRKIAEDYTYNMRYWVKNWEAKNIIKMREDIVDMVQRGARLPELQEYFEQRWGIAKNKAFFLAKNESHIAGSVITKTQYQKLGCTQFKWGRSNSKEKRILHKEYYNKIFDFDNPPIIDERTGQTGLPGQIYNCQCKMQCVVPDINSRLAKRKEVKNSKTILGKIKNAFIHCKQFNDNNTWRYRRFDQRQTI